jgi:3-hydroxyisobutyrate dehydrogenase-like beta-hydroxyacid dehydrogenase
VQPLAELGAVGVDRVAAAVATSPVSLVCVDSYQTTRAMFEPRDVLKELSGRAVVQLSTGGPREARESEAWFTSHGAQYLDGAILAGPDAIGTSRATILYSGRKETFDGYQLLLKSLGEDARFVGEEVGSAAALDLVWLSKLYGTFSGAAHGAIIVKRKGSTSASTRRCSQKTMRHTG